jgi:hypothetical protein
MRRSLLALIVGMCALASSATARIATREEMRTACQTWLEHVVTTSGSWSGVLNPQVIAEHELQAGDTLLAVSFLVKPQGYVLVSGLTVLTPVQAYSDRSDWDVNDPPGFQRFLRERLLSEVRTFSREAGLSGESASGADQAALARAKDQWAWLLRPGDAAAVARVFGDQRDRS